MDWAEVEWAVEGLKVVVVEVEVEVVVVVGGRKRPLSIQVEVIWRLEEFEEQGGGGPGREGREGERRQEDLPWHRADTWALGLSKTNTDRGGPSWCHRHSQSLSIL